MCFSRRFYDTKMISKTWIYLHLTNVSFNEPFFVSFRSAYTYIERERKREGHIERERAKVGNGERGRGGGGGGRGGREGEKGRVKIYSQCRMLKFENACHS